MISVGDWRGILAFAFTLGFFAVFTLELLLNRGFEGSRLLLPLLSLILGFYFGGKTYEKALERFKSSNNYHKNS